MAQNIFHQNSEFLYSNAFDIIPLSLGINIENQSKNEDIIKEGDLMKVIIKIGTKIPCSNIISYKSYEDNQKEIKIDIFEGKNQYVKYNHELGDIIIKDLPEKRKGEIKIYQQNFILILMKIFVLQIF
jgi:molecular chaperone DnaK